MLLLQFHDAPDALLDSNTPGEQGHLFKKRKGDWYEPWWGQKILSESIGVYEQEKAILAGKDEPFNYLLSCHISQPPTFQKQA